MSEPGSCSSHYWKWKRNGASLHWWTEVASSYCCLTNGRIRWWDYLDMERYLCFKVQSSSPLTSSTLSRFAIQLCYRLERGKPKFSNHFVYLIMIFCHAHFSIFSYSYCVANEILRSGSRRENQGDKDKVSLSTVDIVLEGVWPRHPMKLSISFLYLFMFGHVFVKKSQTHMSSLSREKLDNYKK